MFFLKVFSVHCITGRISNEKAVLEGDIFVFAFGPLENPHLVFCASTLLSNRKY